MLPGVYTAGRQKPGATFADDSGTASECDMPPGTVVGYCF
jgi:hypothetical protein